VAAESGPDTLQKPSWNAAVGHVEKQSVQTLSRAHVPGHCGRCDQIRGELGVRRVAGIGRAEHGRDRRQQTASERVRQQPKTGVRVIETERSAVRGPVVPRVRIDYRARSVRVRFERAKERILQRPAEFEILVRRG